MTRYPYPQGDALDELLDKRAPGLSYLWPLAVAVGLVPKRSKPLDVFELVKTWDKPKDRLATEAIAELYALAVLWAQVDRVRGRFANAQAERVQGWLAAEQGAENAPYAYEYWAGDRQVPAPDIEDEDPEVAHDHLWREYNRRERLLAGKLEGMCSRSEGFRDQTEDATEAKKLRAKNTDKLIIEIATRTPGERKDVARIIEKALVEKARQYEAAETPLDFNVPSFGTILNKFSELLPGDAWKQRH